MKSRNSPQVSTFMQPYVTYYTAAFPSYRLSIAAHLVIGNLSQKDLSWIAEEEVQRRSRTERSQLRASTQGQQSTTPHSCIC